MNKHQAMSAPNSIVCPVLHALSRDCNYTPAHCIQKYSLISDVHSLLCATMVFTHCTLCLTKVTTGAHCVIQHHIHFKCGQRLPGIPRVLQGETLPSSMRSQIANIGAFLEFRLVSKFLAYECPACSLRMYPR